MADAEKGAIVEAEAASLKQSIEVAFRDVSYVVQAPPATPKKGPPCCKPSLVDKTILNRMTGVVSPGQFLAIIGASGSGKTSLLNCLANHYSPTSGNVWANGRPLSENDRHAIAYIAQEDHLMPTSTVFDTLNLSAQLRLPRSWSYERKTARVEELLQLFRLDKHRDTLVGSADEMIRGISGGERKRLSIAVELIAFPSVVFLDEPTSGLDSKIAADVCNILKDIARGGCTIIASIHQPSSEVFAQFDQLMILSQGRTVYFGPAASSTDYFASIAPELECPVKYNPADYFMQLTYQGVDAADGRESSAWTTDKLVSEFENRMGAEIKTKCSHHEAQVSQHKHFSAPLPVAQHKSSGRVIFSAVLQGLAGVQPRDRRDRPTFCTAIRMLNSRSLKNLLRNKMLFAARIGQVRHSALHHCSPSTVVRS
jgi:ABC-type multidrug transport system ATPase subunit